MARDDRSTVPINSTIQNTINSNIIMKQDGDTLPNHPPKTLTLPPILSRYHLVHAALKSLRFSLRTDFQFLSSSYDTYTNQNLQSVCARMTNTDSHDSRSSNAPGDGLTSLGGPSLRSENIQAIQAPPPIIESSSSIDEASEASDASDASARDTTDAGHPITHPDKSPTADEIISMSASEIEKLVISKLIERIKGRLAIVAAETVEGDQIVERDQNSNPNPHHHQQQQQDVYRCGADDCVCIKEGVQGDQAVLSESSGSSGLVDAAGAGVNERNEDGDGEEGTGCDDDAIESESGDDDILWDWSGGIWI
ncbi:hypothetical protein BZA77DRAFT_297335 [Pyronema omphalodes]|nr:hypothetical protein BZA77DRAFT_297335 [Pyronema omphalodes]